MRSGQVRRRFLWRRLDRVFQHGNCLGCFSAAKEVIGHLNSQIGIGGIQSERLAVTFERLLGPVALLFEETIDKPRQGVRFALALAVQGTSGLCRIRRKHISDGSEGGEVGQCKGSDREEENLPSSATGSLDWSLPAQRSVSLTTCSANASCDDLHALTALVLRDLRLSLLFQ